MKASYNTLVCAVAVVLLAQAHLSKAATCKLLELAPCSSAMASAMVPPSQVCCKKIKEQSTCLCQYLKDPKLRNFVSSPNAKKVAFACKAIPSCH